MARGTKLDLDVHKAICATIDLIEEVGFEHITMRRVAQAFNMQAASLYWYIESRDTLLDRVADEIYHRLATVVGSRLVGSRQDVTVRQSYVTIRSYLLGHSGNAEVLSTRTVGGPGYRLLLEHLINALHQQGLPRLATVNGALALLSYTIGSVVTQQAPLATSLPTSADFQDLLASQADTPMVADLAALIADPDHTGRFVGGLDAMLMGFGVSP